MRRLFVTIGLMVVACVVMGGTCTILHFEPDKSGVTRVWLVNDCEAPFEPNGGDTLALGASREVLELGPQSSGEITITRGGGLVATLEVKSLVKPGYADSEAIITLTEPEPGSFEVAMRKTGIVTVHIIYE
jgi:hypothetical protein